MHQQIRKDNLVACLILVLILTVFSGCIQPDDIEEEPELGGPELLVTEILLKRERFAGFEDVTGTVEVRNPSDRDVSMIPHGCPHFTGERKADETRFNVPCPYTNDIAGPTIVPAGESYDREFWFSGRFYYGGSNDPAEDFPPGHYGFWASAVRNATDSEEAFFRLG